MSNGSYKQSFSRKALALVNSRYSMIGEGEQLLGVLRIAALPYTLRNNTRKYLKELRNKRGTKKFSFSSNFLF